MENTLFDFSNASLVVHDYQDHLRQALATQYASDLATLRARGIWPPPWSNDEFLIQQDEARLLSAIADQFGLPWSDSNAAICNATANMINMPTTGHARAVIVRSLHLNYIAARYDKTKHCIRLDLTNLGREMLDLWEDENSLRTET